MGKIKEKINDISGEVKWKAYCVKEWCKNNKEASIVLGTVAAKGAMDMWKVHMKNAAVREERALKDRYIYNHSTGHYYELKRKPKASEWLKIEELKKQGKPLGWILNDMKLLKR